MQGGFASASGLGEGMVGPEVFGGNLREGRPGTGCLARSRDSNTWFHGGCISGRRSSDDYQLIIKRSGRKTKRPRSLKRNGAFCLLCGLRGETLISVIPVRRNPRRKFPRARWSVIRSRNWDRCAVQFLLPGFDEGDYPIRI